MKRLKLLFTLAIPVLLVQNVQAQTSSRLIAEAGWYNNGAIFLPNDSTTYAYTNPRGGDLMNTLKYNTATSWRVLLGDTTYSNDSTIYQQFDANNNIISQTRTFWNGTAWENATKVLHFYNGDNSVDTTVSQIWGGTNWVNISRNVYSYTLGNRLYSDQHQIWNSTTLTFDQSSQKTYFYSVGGNLIQEIGQTYSGSVYSYSYKFDHTYTTGNMLASTTYSVWNGATWVPGYMYNYTYDASNNRTNTLYQTYNTSTSAWENVTLNNYSSFVSNMPQMEIDQIWDTTGGGFWKNNLEYTYSYNSFNQLTNSVAESWNVAGFWEHANGDRAANYYYETYTGGSASVNNVAANGSVNIFPNPAQNTVNFKIDWNDAQPFTVSIFDMNGSIVRQWTVPSTASYTASIPVQNFATGNYVVKISGTNGQMVQQIVVAH